MMGCRFSLSDCRRRSPMPRPSCPWCADTSTHRANFWSLVEDGLFPSEFFDTLRLGFFERNCQLYRCGSHLHWADQGRNFKQVYIYIRCIYILFECMQTYKLHAQSQQKSLERLNAEWQALDMFADQIKARAQIHNFRTITCHSGHSSWRRTRFRFGVDVPGPTIWRHLRSGCHRFHGWDVGSVTMAAVTHTAHVLSFFVTGLEKVEDCEPETWTGCQGGLLHWREFVSLEESLFILVSAWNLVLDVFQVYGPETHITARALMASDGKPPSKCQSCRVAWFFLRRGSCSYGTWFERRVARVGKLNFLLNFTWGKNPGAKTGPVLQRCSVLQAGSERRSGTATDTEADPGHRVGEIGKLTCAIRHLFFTIRDKRWKAKQHPRRNRKVTVGNSNNVTSEIWNGMVPDYNKVILRTENNLARPSVWVRKHPYYCDCNSSVQALTLYFSSFLFTLRLCWHFVCWNALKLGNSKIWAGRSFTACRIGQSRPPFFCVKIRLA